MKCSAIFSGGHRNPRDPITETENGFMESKYYAFRFGDFFTPQSLSDTMTIDAWRKTKISPVLQPPF